LQLARRHASLSAALHRHYRTRFEHRLKRLERLERLLQTGPRPLLDAVEAESPAQA